MIYAYLLCVSIIDLKYIFNEFIIKNDAAHYRNELISNFSKGKI